MKIESQKIEFISQTDNLSIKATSTFASAFADPFNRLMIIASVACLMIMGAIVFASLDEWRNTIIPLCIFVLVGWFLDRYIRAILNREIEISQDGVRYREASRRLFFEWDKIQKVQIEHPQKQITFWKNNKLQRIHEFGLPRRELAVVREVFVKQLKARNIPYSY